MVSPSHSQGLEILEGELSSIKAEFTEEVTSAVTNATKDLQQTLVEQISTRLEQLLTSKFEAAFQSLERRSDRARLNTTDEEDIGAQVGGGSDGSGGGDGGVPDCELDLPIFEGSNPDGWILKLESFFGFHRLTEDKKLEAAIAALDGDALVWFRYENNRRPVLRWEDLKELILRQFRAVHGETLYEQWLSHRQNGTTVDEYRRKFIELMVPIMGDDGIIIPEEIIKEQFIVGLREDIRAEVRVYCPGSVEHAMDLAVKVEDNIRLENTSPFHLL